MELIFEKSKAGRSCNLLPPCDVEKAPLAAEIARQKAPRLPQMAEIDLTRHYSALERRSHGVNNGFYPLGSCTMKYNSKINEAMAALPNFTDIHPLQPENTVQGSLEVLYLAEKYLCEVTGMDEMSLQPAAGAHGELTGLLLIKAYHQANGQDNRRKMIIPDSAHGTNPASASMAGFSVVNIDSAADGRVDLDALRAVCDENLAGLMLTNPNTIGIFEKDIEQICQIVHQAGGLVYYDGANLNGIVGLSRPGDMGFDVIHLNLHKTFSTPHGGGGPGSGPVGCKKILAPFLPSPRVIKNGETFTFADAPQTIGRMKAFYGNFLVVVKALTYLLTIGGQGLTDAAEMAVLNTNYLMKKLDDIYDMAHHEISKHEFVISCERIKKEVGVTALDIAKALLDYGIHPPTIYFPLIVHEALMFEPTETESIETLDHCAAVMREIYELAYSNPEALHAAPQKACIGRPDEVEAARNPRLRYNFE
ncbi:MAG: aminomethyl-transferring glycine dehydrogenase subunit GcvPB [Clostridia bacterium]|nr:aminomethyl-transferring glycine dehydrogenase subunit GcvPB [Clostridia bacterium]MDD4798751.1 aminomethyl-transferring glycine dehydrogenase subunit GcvPB [Clostridia bacterium]